MRISVHISGPKHKTSAQLKWIPPKLVLMVSVGAGAIACRKIVPPQPVKNIRRLQLQRVVRLLLVINQKWKRDPRLFPKHFCILRIPKTDRRQCRSLPPNLMLMRAQLRDVFPAENSTVVSQENHHRRLRRPQRPQPDLPSIRIRQHKHRQPAAQRFTHKFPRKAQSIAIILFAGSKPNRHLYNFLAVRAISRLTYLN